MRDCGTEVIQMPAVIERHVTAGPELREKLDQSRKLAQQQPARSIRCPSCSFYLLDVYGQGHYLIRVKCRKCKFDETIDTALFRTMRSKNRSCWLKKRKRRMSAYGKDLHMY